MLRPRNINYKVRFIKNSQLIIPTKQPFSRKVYPNKGYQNPSLLPPSPIKLSEIENELDRETKNDEICYSSIKQLNAMIRTGKITISEITEEIIKRRRYLDTYNFLVSDTEGLLDLESKLVAAKLKEQKLPDNYHFFTYGLKDIEAMSSVGTRYTEGSLLYELFPTPSTSSPLARLLMEHDGIFVGTTALPEFSHKSDKHSRVIGQTRNPHNPHLSIGGSSGGSAGVVATGIAHTAFGTDDPGSIVIPAAFAGVVGFKPIRTQFHPIPTEPSVSLGFGPGYESKGWFTRTVEDCAVVMDILSGYQYSYASCLDEPIYLPNVDVTYLPSFEYSTVETPIFNAMEEAVNKIEIALKKSITRIDTLGFSDPSEAAETHWYSQYALKYNNLKSRFGAITDWEKLLDSSLLRIIEKASSEKQTQSKKIRDEISGLVREFFEDREFLITPATPVLPWKAGRVRPPDYDNKPGAAHTPFTYVFSYARLPSIVLPCATVPVPNEDPNMPVPVGLQIVASDKVPIKRFLQFAKFCEGLFNYSQRPRWRELSLPPKASTEVRTGLDPSKTVKEVKKIFEAQTGIDSSKQRLIYNNQILKDTKLLSDYNITNTSQVILYMESNPHTISY